MQISRHLLLTCAVAACLTPTLVHAADNEAQIRARQALEEKMTQMPAATAPTNPPPMVSKPKAVAAQPAPVVTVTPSSTTVESQPASSATIHAATPSNDDATQQKLEEALHQTPSQPTPAVQQPAPVMQHPAPVVQQPAPVDPKPATVEAQPAMSTPSYISAPSNDDATNQKLQDALSQKMQQTPAEPTTPAMATQKPMKPAKAMQPAATANYATQPVMTPAPTANYAPVPMTSSSHPNLPEQPTPQPMPVTTKNQPPMMTPSVSLPALQGPATGLSSTKEQKLNELLNQYRADQITPQQYHEQRAKILAEP